MREIFNSISERMGTSVREALRPTDREEEFSDREGRFVLAEIVPGKYRLCVSADQYAPKLTDSFSVEIGQTVQDLVVGLGPGASIIGKTVSPHAPVKGASIRITVDRDQGPDLRVALDTMDECESDREGRFEIRNIPPGKFVLRASHPDYPSVSTDPIELKEGQALAGVLINFPPGARITGTALDAQGMLLSDQTVFCRGADGRRDFKRDRTDREGRFEFGELRAGTYSVSMASGFMGFRGRAGDGEGAVEVIVGEGDVQDIVLLKGALKGAVVHGVITDGTAPISRGFLTVSPAEGQGREGMRNAPINGDGTYEVEGVQAGLNRFSLRFRFGENFESVTLEFDIPDFRDVLLDIVLPGGALQGMVLDGATGLPLKGIRVALAGEGETIEPDRGGRGRGFGGMRFGGGGKSATTDEEGAFKLAFLEPGTYRLEARPSNSLPQGGPAGYFPVRLEDIVLAENQSKIGIRLVMSPGGGFEVTVKDKNNNPVPNAVVTALKDAGDGSRVSGRGIRARTDGEGLASLDGIEPGDYTISIQARDMGQESIGGLYVAPGRYTRVDAALEKGFNVSARLTDRNGQPVNGANLTLRNAQGSLMPIPRRGGGGGGQNVYTLGNLVPGSYTLEARWQGTTGTGGFNVNGAGTIGVVLK